MLLNTKKALNIFLWEVSINLFVKTVLQKCAMRIGLDNHFFHNLISCFLKQIIKCSSSKTVCHKLKPSLTRRSKFPFKSIPHNNKSAQDDVMGNDGILDNESLQIIEAIYDVDFKNFQYSEQMLPWKSSI